MCDRVWWNERGDRISGVNKSIALDAVRGAIALSERMIAIDGMGGVIAFGWNERGAIAIDVTIGAIALQM
ncbi:MAG: hypothetical protein AAGD25_18585 [Cyanobacteria bacterium P01_F01_bin.150]